MIEKRFTIKPQDDYFAVVDNNTGDKTCVVNGIRTEIEAEWLCDLLNELAEENKKLKSENNMLKVTIGRNEAYINRLTHTSKWKEY